MSKEKHQQVPPEQIYEDTVESMYIGILQLARDLFLCSGQWQKYIIVGLHLEMIRQQPSILTVAMTTQDVSWYSDHFPHSGEEYVVVSKTRYSLDQLTVFDLYLLHKLYPDGPTVIS